MTLACGFFRRLLLRLLNRSFTFSTFHSPRAYCEMKIAKVIPLFKNGNKSEFSNYRPISLLSQFSKILEKLFNERLQQFLNTNNILSNSQYGFRTHMSTVHAALELTESISDSIDSKQHCAGVFIDLKKAFDTVNHKLLVEKIIILWGKRDRKYVVRKLSNEQKTVCCS